MAEIIPSVSCSLNYLTYIVGLDIMFFIIWCRRFLIVIAEVLINCRAGYLTFCHVPFYVPF